MTISYPDFVQEKNTPTHFNSYISFIKKFPTGVPVYITCTYPNYGDVQMLVTPLYYSHETFRCSILAIGFPIPPTYILTPSDDYENVYISVYHIKSYRRWGSGDQFLNFGNGYITEQYLNMILTEEDTLCRDQIKS